MCTAAALDSQTNSAHRAGQTRAFYLGGRGRSPISFLLTPGSSIMGFSVGDTCYGWQGPILYLCKVRPFALDRVDLGAPSWLLLPGGALCPGFSEGREWREPNSSLFRSLLCSQLSGKVAVCASDLTSRTPAYTLRRARRLSRRKATTISCTGRDGTRK